MRPSWPWLSETAQAEVQATQAALPAELIESARSVPTVLEAVPSQAILDDGFDSGLLGLFVGSSLDDSDSASAPPQIILYLENLWEAAEDEETVYREEVRMTYLHELGHYLGLDEDDLEERGLL